MTYNIKLQIRRNDHPALILDLDAEDIPYETAHEDDYVLRSVVELIDNFLKPVGELS